MVATLVDRTLGVPKHLKPLRGLCVGAPCLLNILLPLDLAGVFIVSPTSGINRGAQAFMAPLAACPVRPHIDQLARRFAKSALTAGTSLTGIFITVVVVDRYAASSSATASMSDCAS